MLEGGASLVPIAARHPDRPGQGARGQGAGLVQGGRAGEAGGTDVDSPVAKFLSDEEKAGLVATTGAGGRRPGADRRRRVPADLPRPRGAAARARRSAGVRGTLPVPVGGRLPAVRRRGRATGNPVAAHHPFTMPHPDDLDRLASDPASVRSQAYDLVLNGWELGSGSVRVHRADIQSRIFAALGISDEEAASRFGFLLGAFRFGAPPHAGFAVGLDRLVAIFAGEDNIREVIAFPKTQSGWDPMTDAPKPLGPRRAARPRAPADPEAGLRTGWPARTSSPAPPPTAWRRVPRWPPGCDRGRSTTSSARRHLVGPGSPPAGAHRVGPADLGHPVGAARAPARPRWPPWWPRPPPSTSSRCRRSPPG